MKLDSQIINDLQLTNISNYVPLKTIWGKSCFYNQLTEPHTDTNEIKSIQKCLAVFRKQKDTKHKLRMELDNIDQEAIQSITSNTKDPLVDESLHQIFWKQDSFGSFLNTFPTVLNGIITWKTILLPGIAILMPLIALIVPFIFLSMTSTKPISTSDYLVNVKQVLLQQISIPSVLRSRGSDDRFGFLLESLFIGITLATFISSLWNQIQSALHLRSIWNSVKVQGRAVLSLVSSFKRILDILKGEPIKYQRILRSHIERGDIIYASAKVLEECDEISAYGTLWNKKDMLDEICNWIGHIDVYTSIASLSSICLPKHTVNSKLRIIDVGHPELQTCIHNSFSTEKPHMILTGPNRGGKTTFCRALGLAILTAQSWGFAWARRMEFSPFSAIYTALETNGVLGNMSKFEAEIEFAKHVLSSKGPTFVMMDEIFHSTNATDGVAASTVFLKHLYERPDIISIISTHYKELANVFGDQGGPASAYQMVATTDENGTLTYTYTIAPGVSETSSVMEILAERGLLRPTAVNTPN
jgi:hypothetical protein